MSEQQLNNILKESIPQLQRYARKYLHPKVELDDLVQLGLVVLYENYLSGEYIPGEASLVSYSQVSLRNAWIDYLRKETHKKYGTRTLDECTDLICEGSDPAYIVEQADTVRYQKQLVCYSKFAVLKSVYNAPQYSVVKLRSVLREEGTLI